MRQVLRNILYINGASCRAVQALNLRPAAPRCAICQRWGHPAQICRSPVVRCPICAQAHDERNHDRVAIQAPTKCFNCNDPHRADSVVCPFFQHRRDREWIQAHSQPSRGTALNTPHIDLRQHLRPKRGTRTGVGRPPAT